MRFSERKNYLPTAIALFIISFAWLILMLFYWVESAFVWNKLMIASIIMTILLIPPVIIKSVDCFLCSLAEIVINENGIERFRNGKKIQSIAWGNVKNIFLVARTSIHSNLVVSSGIYIIGTEHTDKIPKKSTLFRGIFPCQDFITFTYTEDNFEEIQKYYKKDIPGPKPYDWRQYQ